MYRVDVVEGESMGRYPRKSRAARVKCIECNAPVVETVDGEYACVSCGNAPLSARSERPNASVEVADATADD